MAKGKLYLIPSTLGNTDVNYYLPQEVINIIHSLDEFIVENEKSARKFLKEAGITIPQSQLIIHEIDKHDDRFDYSQFLLACLAGKSIGLISEAGAPAVADPGAAIVLKAHEKQISVVPLTGPSSILLALMASGLNGQQFCFQGYLPVEKHLREQKLKYLERESQQKKQTQIFIETPYRNNSMVESILKNCDGNTLICMATEITLATEKVTTQKVSQWKKSVPELNKKPTVFLMFAS